jgi:hypothetical protein
MSSIGARAPQSVLWYSLAKDLGSDQSPLLGQQSATVSSIPLFGKRGQIARLIVA